MGDNPWPDEQMLQELQPAGNVQVVPIQEPPPNIANQVAIAAAPNQQGAAPTLAGGVISANFTKVKPLSTAHLGDRDKLSSFLSSVMAYKSMTGRTLADVSEYQTFFEISALQSLSILVPNLNGRTTLSATEYESVIAWLTRKRDSLLSALTLSASPDQVEAEFNKSFPRKFAFDQASPYRAWSVISAQVVPILA
jgi:hypothetical protein